MKTLSTLFPDHIPKWPVQTIQIKASKADYDLLFAAFPWRGGIAAIGSILLSKFITELKLNNLTPINSDANTLLILTTLEQLSFNAKSERPRMVINYGPPKRNKSNERRGTPGTPAVSANHQTIANDPQSTEETHGESHQRAD